jgi:very-short-patch-repair endonuclease
MNNYYNSNLKGYARELRTLSQSKAEKYLWKAALSRGQMGVKFKRQRPILHYIVDFYCQELNLVIEIDGSSHLNKGEYDARRQKQLENIGCVFLRFNEGEVMQRYDYVQTQIEQAILSLKK